jgi:hypothetical protein
MLNLLKNSSKIIKSKIRTLNFISKYNFTVTKDSDDHFDIRIVQSRDIEDLKKDVSKLEGSGLHLDINPNISKEKFKELFEVLTKTKQEEFHLDMTNVQMDDEKIQAIKKCMSNWNLKHLQIHISNTKFTDEQFKEFISSFKNMKNLYFLNLELENVNLSRKKRQMLDDAIKDIPSLRNIHINVKRTEAADEDLEIFSRLMDTSPFRKFLL